MMLTHRDIIRGLTTDEKRALTTLSDLAGMRHLLGHIVIIAIFAWINAVSTGGWQIAAMLGQGIAMVFLFTAMHECSHKTAFRTGWINRGVGTIVGFVLFLLPRWFFYFHQAHHKFTQDPLRDPELAAPKPATKAQYLWYLSGIPVWRDHLSAVIGVAFGRRSDAFVPPLAQAAVQREAIGFMFGYVVLVPVLAYGGYLLQFWLVPLLLGQPFLRLYLLAEHADCAETDNMLVNTRTLATTPVIRFLAWNMPFHAEHHSFTAVPFHQLPALRAHMRGKLHVMTAGYTAFHRDYYRNLAGRVRELF